MLPTVHNLRDTLGAQGARYEGREEAGARRIAKFEQLAHHGFMVPL